MIETKTRWWWSQGTQIRPSSLNRNSARLTAKFWSPISWSSIIHLEVRAPIEVVIGSSSSTRTTPLPCMRRVQIALSTSQAALNLAVTLTEAHNAIWPTSSRSTTWNSSKLSINNTWNSSKRNKIDTRNSLLTIHNRTKNQKENVSWERKKRRSVSRMSWS